MTRETEYKAVGWLKEEVLLSLDADSEDHAEELGMEKIQNSNPSYDCVLCWGVSRGWMRGLIQK